MKEQTHAFRHLQRLPGLSKHDEFIYQRLIANGQSQWKLALKFALMMIPKLSSLMSSVYVLCLSVTCTGSAKDAATKIAFDMNRSSEWLKAQETRDWCKKKCQRMKPNFFVNRASFFDSGPDNQLIIFFAVSDSGLAHDTGFMWDGRAEIVTVDLESDNDEGGVLESPSHATLVKWECGSVQLHLNDEFCSISPTFSTRLGLKRALFFTSGRKLWRERETIFIFWPCFIGSIQWKWKCGR